MVDDCKKGKFPTTLSVPTSSSGFSDLCRCFCCLHWSLSNQDSPIKCNIVQFPWDDQCKMKYVTYIFILVILTIAMVFTMFMNIVGLLLLLLLLLVVAGTVWMTEGQSTVHWQRLLSSLHHSPNHHHHNHHPFDQHHYDYHCASAASYNH